MADFRRWIYALALVALLAGFTIPASAQGSTVCSTTAGVPPTIRAEGWTELTGDLIITCQGGTSTSAGQTVPQVNITVTINTYFTSRLLSSNGIWTEALLIMDEPHSTSNPARNILNCGNTGAADSGPSGADVCAIVSDGNPVDTYDGSTNSYGASTTCPSTNVGGTYPLYACGRPNVFQGRLGTPAVPGQQNAVSWLGVPFDPPGTTTSRTIRITNIRADAHDANTASAGNFFLSYIQAEVSINGNTSINLSTSQEIIAYIGPGLTAGIKTTNFSFLQCVNEHFGATSLTGVTTPTQTNGAVPSFTFTEGFASSWKAKNIAHILNATGHTGNGFIPVAGSYWAYDGFSNFANGTINYPPDFNQNVPGAIYNTESGFMYPGSGATLDAGASDPSPNPPIGTTTSLLGISSTAYALHNGTGIDNAGIADNGTRLQVQISNIPTGSTVLVPEVIYLTNGTSTSGVPNHSGVAVLVNTDAAGAGTYSPVATGTVASVGAGTYISLPSSGMAVYEILFADPFSIESMTVSTIVSYNPNLNLNQPDPTKTAQAFGGFAPFYNTSAAHLPSSTLPIPRFVQATVPASTNYFSISRCACNLLFPFVAATGGYDTGIAIANTSMDNLGTGGTSAANSQFGGVEFWYYGVGNNGGAAPPTQCTNIASPGTCPSPSATSSSTLVGQVPAGQILTYVLSSGAGNIGTGANGLDNRAAGFEGYIIAQAQFQYCHAYAFITAIGAGPLSQAVSEGYLGLVLDNKSWNCLSSAAAGLCRTNQSAENLVH